jgi:IS4 transposase
MGPEKPARYGAGIVSRAARMELGKRTADETWRFFKVECREKGKLGAGRYSILGRRIGASV